MIKKTVVLVEQRWAFQFISDCYHVADIHVYSAVGERFALEGNAYVRLGRSIVPDRAKFCGMTKTTVVPVVLRYVLLEFSGISC